MLASTRPERRATIASLAGTVRSMSTEENADVQLPFMECLIGGWHFKTAVPNFFCRLLLRPGHEYPLWKIGGGQSVGTDNPLVAEMRKHPG
jgi:hypothetical protein